MFVGIAAMVAYLAIWNHFHPPLPRKLAPTAGKSAAVPVVQAPGAGDAAAKEAVAATWAALPPAAGAPASEALAGISMEGKPPRWRATLAAQGGSLRAWTILAEGDSSLHVDGRVVAESVSGRFPGEVVLGDNGTAVDLGGAVWEGRPSGTGAAFAVRLVNGLEVVKEYIPGPDPDGLTLRISFRNQGHAPCTFKPKILAACGLPQKEDRQDTPYPSEGVILTRREDGTIRRVAQGLKDLEKPLPFTEGPVVWGGLANKYFLLSVRPELAPDAAAPQAVWEALKKEKEKDKTELGLWFEGPELVLAPGQSAEASYRMLAIPKKLARAEAHADLALAIHRQWTWWIEVPLFVILTFWYGVTGNYGAAILLLTVLVKVLMHPLSVNQQSSMQKMQEKMKKLMPKIEEINEKYKNNMRKRTEETMKLYKEHGNPQMAGLKGCLPLLLQMPIFIALYAVIANAVELRGAPFCLWIRDLAVPDRLVVLPSWAQVNLYLTRIEDVNLLPILMTVASFIQMWMNPAPPAADPEQAKQQKFTQYFAFVFMGFILYNMASGLVLYWFANTVLGIFEYKLIQRRLKAAKALPPLAVS